MDQMRPIRSMLPFFGILGVVILASPAATFLVKVVIADCLQGTIWVPPPRAVKNACLQCLCVFPNYSVCKSILVLPHVTCTVIEPTHPTTPTTTTTTTASTTTSTSKTPTSEEEEEEEEER